MKYTMFIHYKPGYYDALSADAQQAVVAEYRALAQDPRARDSAQLQPIETATTVRVQDDGQTLTTDGPYADNPEVFGAYYVFEGNHLDEAIELTARFPATGDRATAQDQPLGNRSNNKCEN